MAVCLDTSFLVDLLSEQPSAVSFAEALEEPAAISSISFYELLFGVTNQRQRNFAEALSRDYVVIPVDYDVCAMAAAIQARLRDMGNLIPAFDAIIAATAILAEAALVTTDEHFLRIPTNFGLTLLDYRA